MTSLAIYVAQVPIQPMYSPHVTAWVKITWVGIDFLSQDKISDILIWCARKTDQTGQMSRPISLLGTHFVGYSNTPQILEKSYSIFLTYTDIIPTILLKSIQIWTIGTIHSWLPLDGFRYLDQCPRVKISDIFRVFFVFFKESFVFEPQVLFSIDIYSNSYLKVQCPRVGLGQNLVLYETS